MIVYDFATKQAESYVASPFHAMFIIFELPVNPSDTASLYVGPSA